MLYSSGACSIYYHGLWNLECLYQMACSNNNITWGVSKHVEVQRHCTKLFTQSLSVSENDFYKSVKYYHKIVCEHSLLLLLYPAVYYILPESAYTF